MWLVSGAELKSVLHLRMLIERLRQTFRAGGEVPPRHEHRVATWGQNDASLQIMPSWQVGQAIGIRIVTKFPDNDGSDFAPVQGSYLLIDGKNGMPQAVLDGPALARRTAAASSALAASYLARPDSGRLLVVGTGALAAEMIQAHTHVLPIKHVLVWGRRADKAKKLAARFHRPAFRIEATDDLAGAVQGADVVCCATSASEAVIRADWLQPGQHIDLAGAVGPDRQELDAAGIGRCRVFVDTREGALAEAGDLLAAISAGVISADDIAGDLYDLGRGERAGRRFYDQITLYKSVGTALGDLCAARLAVEMVVHNDTLR